MTLQQETSRPPPMAQQSSPQSTAGPPVEMSVVVATKAPAFHLRPSTSNYLLDVGKERLSSIGVADLLAGAANDALPFDLRLSALNELVQRQKVTNGVLTFPANPSLPSTPAVRTPASSPPPGSPRPEPMQIEDTQHVLAPTEDVAHGGDTISVVMDDGPGVEIQVDNAGQVAGVASAAGGQPAPPPPPSLTLTPLDARRHLETRGLTSSSSWPAELSYRPAKGAFAGPACVNSSLIPTGLRPPLTDGARADVLAAALVVADYYAIQRAEYSRYSGKYDFRPDLSNLLTSAEKSTMPAQQQADLLSTLLTGAHVVLARTYTIYAEQVNGADVKELVSLGVPFVGPALDWDSLINDTSFAGPDLASQLRKAELTLSTKENRYAQGKVVELSLSRAMERVAQHETRLLHWHLKMPAAAVRDYDSIRPHPSFDFIRERLRTSTLSALRRHFAKSDDVVPSTAFTIHYLADEKWSSKVIETIQETQNSVAGFPPVTAGLNYGDGTVDSFIHSSAAFWFWYPFLRGFWDEEVPKLIAQVRAEKASSTLPRELSSGESSNEALRTFNLHKTAKGIVRIANSNDRRSAAKSAIGNAQHLASMTTLFEHGGQSSRIVALPPLHSTSAAGQTHVWEFSSSAAELEKQIEKLNQDIKEKHIATIEWFGEGVEPVSSFDRGRLGFTRPASCVHDAPYRFDQFSANAIESDDGLVRLQYDNRMPPVTDSSLLGHQNFINKHLTADHPLPPHGTSVIDGQQRRRDVDEDSPWNPSEQIEEQARYLRTEVEAIASSAEAVALFLEIRKMLEDVAVSRTSGSAFGKHYNGRVGLDSFYMCRDALQIVYDEGFVEKEDMQVLWSLMVNTLTFAVLSKRPAILVSILPAAIHALDLQLNNPADAGRAEQLLAQVHQQFGNAMLCLIVHSDAQCATCGRATYANKACHPAPIAQAGSRTLSWTTMGSARAVAQAVWTKPVILGMWGGIAPGEAMVGCLYEYEMLGMSLSARAAAKAFTSLTHKDCKTGRGRKTLIPLAVQKALGGKDKHVVQGGEQEEN